MKKTVKNIVYRLLYAVRNILNPFLNFQEVSILAYHSISDESLDTAVSTREFARQMEYLKAKGFSFVSLDTITTWLDEFRKVAPYGKRKVRPYELHKAVAITFDDGYVDFETTALPILERYAAPVTLFIMTPSTSEEGEDALHTNLHSTIPLLSADAIERVRQHSLVEIGFHGTTHAPLSTLTGDALRREIKSASFVSNAGAATGARFFAYPGGNYSAEAVTEVEKAGYEAGFSIKRRLLKKGQNRYLLPRSVVTHDMKPWLVGVHVTKAIDWYRALVR